MVISLSAGRRLLGRAHLLVPGVYAWLATVASPTLAREAPSAARATAFVALVALVAGPYVAIERPRAGRLLGVFLFVALCCTTWVLLGQELTVDRLEPVQASLGGLGWAAFAFGWGSLRQPGAIPEDHPNVLLGSPLQPRGALPSGALPVLGVAIFGSILLLTLAWRVARPDHALLAHAVAITCAIALLSTGAQVATLRGGRSQPQSVGRRISAARRWLWGLLIAVLLGVFWQTVH